MFLGFANPADGSPSKLDAFVLRRTANASTLPNSAPLTFRVPHPLRRRQRVGLSFSLHSSRFSLALSCPPMDPLDSLHPIESNSAFHSRVEGVAAPIHKKRKSQNPPPFANAGEGWGTLKFHFKHKCKSKATANRRSVKCRGGIIAAEVQSIVGNTDAEGRATRLMSRTEKSQPRRR